MSLTARQTWSESNVSLIACGPNNDIIIGEDGPLVQGFHEWQNDNPSDADPTGHAYVRAQVLIDGVPTPVDVDDSNPYRRQVNDTTYEMQVGPDGANHAMPFQIHIDDLPVGEGIPHQADPLEIRQQSNAEF